MTVVAFVPADEGYIQWDVMVSDVKFTAIQDGRVFIVVGYSHDQFTKQMMKLWEFEKI